MTSIAGRAPWLIVAVAFAWQAPNALAFNAFGHKVVADIAWRQLDEETRSEIVRTLRRHPRFDEDFAKKAPTDGDQDRWIFQQAATWPDLIRGNKEYDHPTWHYINHPIFVGDERAVTFNRIDFPAGDPAGFNVVQAIAKFRLTLRSDASPSDKAIAYCWLFHLVGDIHQPLHAVALVGDRFPDGDRGGNSIPLVQGGNLHSLWDGLLGRDDRMADVAREVAELEQHKAWWNADAKADVPVWVAESRELCNSTVYDPIILEAVKSDGDLAPISLPEAYLKNAGEKARERVVAAGIRLGYLLGAGVEPHR